MDSGCYQSDGLIDLRFENFFDMLLRFNEGVDSDAHLDALQCLPSYFTEMKTYGISFNKRSFRNAVAAG